MNPQPLMRSAIIDLGSNSVRLVVFEGRERNPVIIFNEKATLRLGSGLQTTGKLNPVGVALAQDVFKRFYAVAKGMNASPFVILATAAVRDAQDGKAFIEQLHQWMPEVRIQILTGEEEADYASAGVLCSIPEAEGIVADIGGGSLELLQLSKGKRFDAISLPLGVIRLTDRAGQKLSKAGIIVGKDLKTVPWLGTFKKKTLYLVGGAFRALAQLYIEYTAYPLAIVHYYTLSHVEAKRMVDWILDKTRETGNHPMMLMHKRSGDLPYAAMVLKHLLMVVKPLQIIFCAEGVREGWYMRKVIPETIREQNPQEAAALDICNRLGRVKEFPAALMKWTSSLFKEGEDKVRQWQWDACLISDCGCIDHPSYRKEQAYFRILRMASMAFDHQMRAFLALVVAIRYDASVNEKFLSTSRKILTSRQYEQAVILGTAFRLAYTLSANLPDLLLRTRLKVGKKKLTLYFSHHLDAVIRDNVVKRLNRLGQLMGLEAQMLSDEKKSDKTKIIK